jgi:hypothetical protein
MYMSQQGTGAPLGSGFLNGYQQQQGTGMPMALGVGAGSQQQQLAVRVRPAPRDESATLHVRMDAPRGALVWVGRPTFFAVPFSSRHAGSRFNSRTLLHVRRAGARWRVELRGAVGGGRFNEPVGKVVLGQLGRCQCWVRTIT